MPTLWAPVTGTLYELKTSAKVIVQLMSHALLLHGPSAIIPTNPVQALMAQAGSNCADKAVKCENCSCTSHTKDKCFRKGSGMEEQYLKWWCKAKPTPSRTSSNTSGITPATSALQANLTTLVLADNSDNLQCLVFATLMHSKGDNITMYADLAVSWHFFINRGNFVLYHKPDAADAAGVTAEGHKFKILEWGWVCK